MIQLGDIKLHLIIDANTQGDPGGTFGLVPRALWSRYISPDENQLIPMPSICVFAQVGQHNIIVDTGYGNKYTEKQQKIWQLTHPRGDLLDGLARLGVSPEDITLVIDTHLHNDHAGGNTRYNQDGQIVSTFPNAEYVVQRREFEDANRPNERTAATYLSYNWDLLVRNGQLRLLDGDTTLVPGVTGIVAPGHTPGHMAVRFESLGQHAAFVCDMATYSIHFERLGWMTSFDVEPLVTLETKRHWQDWALETNALIMFPHDPLRASARLYEDEHGKRSLVAVPEPYV